MGLLKRLANSGAPKSCRTCDGLGEVRTKDGMKICPACNGWG